MKSRFLCFALSLVISVPVAAQGQEGTVYAFDLRTRDGFLVFPASDPTSLDFVTKNRAPFALDFNPAGTILYAVDSNTLEVGTLNQMTGQFTATAELSGAYAGGIPTGLAADPTTGTFFLSNATQLYTLNVNTGATTLIGSYGLGGTVIDIAINNGGQLFAHELDGTTNGIVTGGLYSVNKATAAPTFIGTSGLESVFAQGMDFDPATNTLYAAIYTGGGNGSYGTWNTTTGAFTQIAALPAFGPVELEMAISGGTTFAYNFRTIPNTFIRFPAATPLPISSTANVDVYTSFAMDFAADGTTLHMFDNFLNNFGTVDLATGCFTVVAPRSGALTVDPGGMSCNPVTDTFYAVANGNELYLVDVDTGVTALQTVMTSLSNVVDIAFNAAGQMYAFSITDDSLYSVDITTGAATFVGANTVGDANFAQGMDFDPVTDTLYQAIYTGGGTGRYGSWNLSTGVFTEILPLLSFEDPVGTGYELEMAIGLSSGCSFAVGDVNQDGVISLLDVAPFVAVLTGGNFQCEADANGDGIVSLLDVAPFVSILTGG